MMRFDEAVQALNGAQLRGDGAVRFKAVSTDSRKLARGDLFVALRGPRFDGHAHAAEAVAAGAAGVVVDHAVAVSAPQLVVPDTKAALGELATYWRKQFELPVIAVTGSNGKTTVTQMLAAMLAAAVGTAHRWATQGNFNNDIGLPLMVLGLRAEHRMAVFELGMNQPGEIAHLAAIARPHVALVNNAQREHQAFFASAQETAVENGAVIAALPDDGVAVFPAKDPCAPIWRRLAGTRRILDFSLDGGAAVVAKRVQEGPGHSVLAIESEAGVFEVVLKCSGQHMLHNALAATTCALALGIAPADVASGLAAFEPVSGRGRTQVLSSGALLVDDSYNANPDSVRAAIDFLTHSPPPCTLILADMGEVGAHGPAFHREVGDYARTQGVGCLLAVGEATRETVLAFGKGATHFEQLPELIERARIEATKGGTLLVKGSRFMRMERVVDALAGVH